MRRERKERKSKKTEGGKRKGRGKKKEDRGQRKEERKGVGGERKEESGQVAVYPGSAGSLARGRDWSNLALFPGLCFLTSKLS